MKILIRAAKILDKTSVRNGYIRDILIENGIITQIGEKLTVEADQIITQPDLHVSAGWFDMRVHAKDPGHEYKEDLESLSNAALAGGFTEIALLPNTKPTIQSKESLAYFHRFSARNLLQLHPMAAITLDTQGKDFTEMIDLHTAGAVAFTDGIHPIENPDILLKTLQYLTQVKGLLVNRPEETALTHYGLMHEGITSTLTGMKGIPAIAEEMMVYRDLKLLEYLDIKSDVPVLHFATISTKEAVRMIREAKAKGLAVSCDVAAHQVAFDDTVLSGFDTNLKVNPPFRSQEDIKAIWEGLADGTIDAIVSDHNPQEEDAKNIEFDRAEFGVIGLETAFSVINSLNDKLTLEQLIEKFTINPRRILRQPQPKIEIGEVANLTVFSPTIDWVFEEKAIQSKAKNSPFIGIKMKGKAVAVFNNRLMKA